MKRHTNLCLSITKPSDFFQEATLELLRSTQKHGGLTSGHEGYAVLLEEVEEFWDGVKANDPDPVELIQVAAMACKIALLLTEKARQEMRKPKP